MGMDFPTWRKTARFNPNVPDTVLRNLFNSLTNDACNSAFDDGVQEIYTDRKSYDLNSSSEVQYEYGHADVFMPSGPGG